MSKSEKLGQYEYNKVPITEFIPEKEDNPPKYGYGVRHIQLAIFLMCLTVNIVGRGHMGVTIVAMTSDTDHKTAVLNTTEHIERRHDMNISKDFHNITDNELAHVSINSSYEVERLKNTTERKHVTYTWPKSVQEMVLNAFFLGYAIMMFPMGMVCQRYGGKLPLQIALIINGVVSIVTPWLTFWGGWKAACCCRILQGLSQSGLYPSIQALLAKWVSPSERAGLSSCVHTGLTLGTVVAYQIAGFLGASRWGWPSTFYGIGVLCLLSFVVLTVFGAANPLEHKTISEAERNYILGAVDRDNASTMKLKTPWRAMATSKPLWGTITTQVGCVIAFVFFFNQVPTYIHYILGANVRNSGLLSSLPYMASFFTTLGFGWLSDYCTNKKIISYKNARRICNSIAQCGIAFCLILTSYSNSTGVAVTCLVVAMAANMGLHTGWMVNYIDLAPNFSGTLTATGNTLANIFIVLTPIVVSNIVTDMTNPMQWRIMFFIIAAIAVICNAVFLVLVSTDIQPWNYAAKTETCVEDPKEDNMKEEKEKK